MMVCDDANFCSVLGAVDPLECEDNYNGMTLSWSLDWDPSGSGGALIKLEMIFDACNMKMTFTGSAGDEAAVTQEISFGEDPDPIPIPGLSIPSVGGLYTVIKIDGNLDKLEISQSIVIYNDATDTTAFSIPLYTKTMEIPSDNIICPDYGQECPGAVGYNALFTALGSVLGGLIGLHLLLELTNKCFLYGPAGRTFICKRRPSDAPETFIGRYFIDLNARRATFNAAHKAEQEAKIKIGKKGCCGFTAEQKDAVEEWNALKKETKAALNALACNCCTKPYELKQEPRNEVEMAQSGKRKKLTVARV
jgi:hypothetical protein